MRANKPSVGENDECLGAQSKLTTAGDTGENAVCPEAQSINKIHENCLRVPRGTTMGTSSPALEDVFWTLGKTMSFGRKRQLANGRKRQLAAGRWTDNNLCHFLNLTFSRLQEDYEADLRKSSVRKAATRASKMVWGSRSTDGTPNL